MHMYQRTSSMRRFLSAIWFHMDEDYGTRLNLRSVPRSQKGKKKITVRLSKEPPLGLTCEVS